MDINNAEEAKKQIAKMRKMLPDMAKEVRDNERIVALMEAGLRERPLDRDFVELVKIRFEQTKSRYELANEMMKMLDKVEL